MRTVLKRILFGCGVAFLSGAADGALIALVDPEHVLENFTAFLALVAALGLKGAFMYFKQHEKDLTAAIEPPPPPTGGLGVLVLAAALVTGACAAATPSPADPPTAANLIRSELVKAVDWAATLVDVARTTQKLEIEAYRNGRMSDRQHRVVQTAFDEFFTGAIEALKTAQDLNRPDVDRWTGAKAVALLGGRLVTQIEDQLPPNVRAYLDSLKALLQLLGPADRVAGEEDDRG